VRSPQPELRAQDSNLHTSSARVWNVYGALAPPPLSQCLLFVLQHWVEEVEGPEARETSTDQRPWFPAQHVAGPKVTDNTDCG